jgi:hypothetical protein
MINGYGSTKQRLREKPQPSYLGAYLSHSIWIIAEKVILGSWAFISNHSKASFSSLLKWYQRSLKEI